MKDFQWRAIVPDLMTGVSMLTGMLFGIMVVLTLLLAVFPYLVWGVLLAGLGWVASFVAYIMLKENQWRTSNK